MLCLGSNNLDMLVQLQSCAICTMTTSSSSCPHPSRRASCTGPRRQSWASAPLRPNPLPTPRSTDEQEEDLNLGDMRPGPAAWPMPVPGGAARGGGMQSRRPCKQSVNEGVDLLESSVRILLPAMS